MQRSVISSLIVVAVLAALAGVGKAELAASVGPKLSRVEDLADKRIAALLGSAHVDYVMKTWPRSCNTALPPTSCCPSRPAGPTLR